MASDYDLRYLTRALVESRAYQLESRHPQGDGLAGEPSLFARMSVRGLTGEQLYDSLRVAAGLPVSEPKVPRGRYDEDPREEFVAQFYVERAVSARRSIVQALALMNGRTTVNVTDPGVSPLLVATAEAPFLDTHGRVATLFLAAFARYPDSKELQPLVEYVDRGGAGQDCRAALADVFWTLLNSSEFNTNH